MVSINVCSLAVCVALCYMFSATVLVSSENATTSKDATTLTPNPTDPPAATRADKEPNSTQPPLQHNNNGPAIAGTVPKAIEPEKTNTNSETPKKGDGNGVGSLHMYSLLVTVLPVTLFCAIF